MDSMIDCDDSLTQLIIWYVECQNEDGLPATEEELIAFGKWYEGVLIDQELVRMMLKRLVRVRMVGDEPSFSMVKSPKGESI